MHLLDLFSGIGGFSLGLERSGHFRTVAFCEIDPWCRSVLAHHWPGVPAFEDVRSLSAQRLIEDGVIDVAGKLKKLTIEQVDEAVKLYDSGCSLADIAAVYSVSRQGMHDLLKRRTTMRPQLRYAAENHFWRGGAKAEDRAHNMVEKAVARGLLQRKPCEVCGANGRMSDGRHEVQAHHDDYSRPLEAEASPEFSETLPRSGMTRNGTLFLLLPLVRLIYATGAGSSRSLLPTPMASDVDKPRRSPGSIARGGGPKLMDVLLPTPTAASYGSNQGGGMGRVGPIRYSLQGMAQRGLIPTPTGDANSSGSRNTATSNAHPGLSLTDWARGDGGTGRLLPTPQAQDFRNCADYSSGSREHSPQLRHLGSGRLNHRFVAWMMGFPETWFDTSATPCAPSGTPLSLPSPNCSQEH